MGIVGDEGLYSFLTAVKMREMWRFAEANWRQRVTAGYWESLVVLLRWWLEA
jgi:hypothetical protein